MAAKEVIGFRFNRQAVRNVRFSTLSPSFLFEHSPPSCKSAQSRCPSDQISHLARRRVHGESPNVLTTPHSSREGAKTVMQKAHLYEAILSLNRGIDEAVQGLERLKRAKDSGLYSACFEEKVALFEIHRASLNSYFCNNVGRNEDRDVGRFEQKHREYEKETLD